MRALSWTCVGVAVACAITAIGLHTQLSGWQARELAQQRWVGRRTGAANECKCINVCTENITCTMWRQLCLEQRRELACYWEGGPNKPTTREQWHCKESLTHEDCRVAPKLPGDQCPEKGNPMYKVCLCVREGVWKCKITVMDAAAPSGHPFCDDTEK